MSDAEELIKIESSIKELQEQGSAIRNRIKKEAIEQARKIIKDHFLNIDDLFDSTSGKTVKEKKVKSKPEPYYVNPSNPGETCAKIGRKPGWFEKALESGMNKDEMKINK